MSHALNLQTLQHYRDEIAYKREIKCEYVERVPLDVMHALLEKAYPQPKQPWYVRLFARAPDFIIGHASRPYMLRWWLRKSETKLSCYLHKIMRSDDDRAVHDHRGDNLSIVLRGSYREIVPDGKDQLAAIRAGKFKTLIRKPGAIVLRKADAAHRLEVDPGKPVWTLFFTMPTIRKWGFHAKEGWLPHDVFLQRYGDNA